jgi:hypothetical protein
MPPHHVGGISKFKDLDETFTSHGGLIGTEKDEAIHNGLFNTATADATLCKRNVGSQQGDNSRNLKNRRPSEPGGPPMAKTEPRGRPP